MTTEGSTPRRQINLRVSEGFLKQLDEVRGGVPREAWIRAALTKEVEIALKGQSDLFLIPVVPAQ